MFVTLITFTSRLCLSQFVQNVRSQSLANTYAGWATGEWKFWIVLALIVLFFLGLVQSLCTYFRAWRVIRKQINQPKPTLAKAVSLAKQLGQKLPFFVILVPARNESAVIRNTINRLTHLDYPRDRYAFIVITDARETADGSTETTQEIARDMAKQLKAGLDSPLLHVIEVPEWYSGQFGNKDKTYAKSTKGRALNYALEQIRDDSQLSKAEMLGVLDADGRLHPEVLREAAYQRLKGEQLMQGPVFQISNFKDASIAGKAAAIELSIFHLSVLSRQLLSRRQTARFLAGTNYFVDLELMIEVGGWKEQALVEDAELGLRLFLQCQVRPVWLSCHELEQTPPDYKVYLKQRERWALGHFQLLPMISQSTLPWHTKIYLKGKVLYAVVKSVFDVGLPVLAWVALFAGWTAKMPQVLIWVMLGLLTGSVFVWDFFGRGARMLNTYNPTPQKKRVMWLLSLKFIVAMPWLILLQAQPRISAFVKYASGQNNEHWEKTERTLELVWEQKANKIHNVSESEALDMIKD